MPRPPKPTAVQHTRQVIFRLTEAEYAQLETLAGRAGLRVNELARRLTQRGRHRLVIQTTRRHDPAFIAQVKRLGANLNQIVKRAHLREFVSPKVEEVCDEIQRIILAAANDEAHE
jgi:hypothetical protein